MAAFIATHLPSGIAARPPLVNDKVLHFLGFALLAIVTMWRLGASQRPITMGHRLAWWMILGVYAIMDELTQPWVGRTFEWADWGADLLGAATGLLVMYFVRSGDRPASPNPSQE